jgi:hypothetical protein
MRGRRRRQFSLRPPLQPRSSPDLTHARCDPDRCGALTRFDTMPSAPSLQAGSKTTTALSATTQSYNFATVTLVLTELAMKQFS